MVDSAFHPWKVEPGRSGELAFKSKLSCHNGSPALRLLITIHKIEAIKFKGFRVLRGWFWTIKSFWADPVEKTSTQTSAQWTGGGIAYLPLLRVLFVIQWNSQEPSFREGIAFPVLLPSKFGRSKNPFITVTNLWEFGFSQSRIILLVQTEEGISKVNGFSFSANQIHVDESIFKIQLQQLKMSHIGHLCYYNENSLNQHKNNLRFWD